VSRLAVPDDPLRGELLLRRAEVARWSGAYAAAETDALAALQLLAPPRASARDAEERFLEALGVAIVAASALGHVPSVEGAPVPEPWSLAESVLFGDREPFAHDREVATLEVITLCRGSAAWLGRGRRDASGRWLDRARARGGESPAPLARAWLAALDASHALAAGDLATFLLDTERAVREYERAGDARNACNQRVRLANALVSVGELERADEALTAARADAERMGLAVIAGYAVQNLGHVRARLGREAQARSLLEDARARADALGDAHLRAGAQLYLALLELAGDPARAIEHAQAATEAVPSGAFFAIARAIEARAALALGRLEDADRGSSEAIAWLDAHGPIEEGEASIRRARADALVALGRPDEARSLARSSYTSIEARAAALAPALRRGYLEGAPDHLRLRELAGAG
ncbi:MAG: hypothetical protein K1X94_35160, partial [Sandaracinaceae bacterium]|nr:hypothetical protein [Sandaracinaceae bacterium]